MDVHDVALVIYGKLVQRDLTLGLDPETHKETAKRAFQYADAFMQASIDYRNLRASIAPARL